MKQLIARTAMVALTAAFMAAASAWTITDMLQDSPDGRNAGGTSTQRTAMPR